MNSTVHTTGGHKKDANCIVEIFFDSMNELKPEKKLVDLHMFDRSSVYRNAKKIEGCLSYTVIYFFIRAYLPEYIEEIIKMCKEYKMC